MKRGIIIITQELFNKLMKDKIPDDFKISGVKFEPEHNCLRIYGYSEQFHETHENQKANVESITGCLRG